MVSDAETALLRAVDEKEAAERPECLSPEMVTGLLVEHNYSLPRIGNLDGRNESSEPSSDYDDICVGHAIYSDRPSLT